MVTYGEDDKKEVIKCLLCQGDVEDAEMIDHIASEHMGYILHKCEGCDFGCHDAERALGHAQETRHPLMLNKCWYNGYTEELVKKAYEDSIAASVLKREETGKIPSTQASTQEEEASSMHEQEDRSAHDDEVLLPSQFFEDQCHECLAFVPDQGKRDHVWKEHLHTTAICPVLGCGFMVTSNSHHNVE